MGQHLRAARGMTLYGVCLALSMAASLATGAECESTFTPAKPDYDFETANRAPPPATSSQAKIGRIHLTRLPIFDEANARENYLLYRWANRFHIMTRPGTVQQYLLFEEGDPLDPRRLAETERLLRDSKFLYDADIRTVNPCGDRVDVEVITRDVWTITPEISFNRSGGENELKLSLSDNNLFGAGNEVKVGYRDEEERSSYDLIYKDPHLRGSRIGLRTRLTDSDDGNAEILVVELPFYSLDTQRAWRVEAQNLTQVETQYYRDDDISEVEHDMDLLDLRYGFSKGLEDGYAHRFSYGLRYERHGFGQGPDLPMPLPRPLDRKFAYPYFQYENVQDEFTVGRDLNQIRRTEDIHLGRRLVAAIGYSPVDEQRLATNGEYEDTLTYDGDSYLTHRFDWKGYWNLERSEPEEVVANYNIRYFRRVTDHRTFFAKGEASWASHLSPEQQILLGGFWGLRGYPNNYQTGNRRYLVNLEHRWYTDYHLLNLVRVGWAVFLDTGRAWFTGADNGSNGGNLTNLGIGLRLASSKTSAGQVIHLDLAFPLQRDDDVENVEFVVAIKENF